LGLEGEIRTGFFAHGEVRDGVLHGALRVRGEGDPTFGFRDYGDSLQALRAVAERLKALGVERVTGDLLVDDSAFDRTLRAPDWPKAALTERWMAGASALSLDEGVVRVSVRPGRKAGDPAAVALEPDVGYCRVTSRLVTAARRSAVTLDHGETPGAFTAKGTVRAGAGAAIHEAAVDDPAIYFGFALRRAFAETGLAVEGRVRRPEPAEAQGGAALLTFRTPISRVLPRLLKSSQNHRAEMLFKHHGFRASGLGTFESGGAATLAALAAAGTPVDGLVLADGSGLSRRNRATAAALQGALALTAARPEGEAFRAMLAEPGQEGTLQKRLIELKGRLFAKTGFLDGAQSLAGYVQGVDGKWTAFAVIMNAASGAPMRKHLDAFALALATVRA
ncbi:MAG TPA: D-alanyl-D-alanine carboxypeptidase/D-alanyl-D-alanine-endopeptidase, partial [Planctomycetota bacterium]|nr:D-alanyl-D-alanine carboxypeptidase/D-alanyl-D-alanine-endopeptidase [Planctomycetota bacterium]